MKCTFELPSSRLCTGLAKALKAAQYVSFWILFRSNSEIRAKQNRVEYNWLLSWVSCGFQSQGNDLSHSRLISWRSDLGHRHLNWSGLVILPVLAHESLILSWRLCFSFSNTESAALQRRKEFSISKTSEAFVCPCFHCNEKGDTDYQQNRSAQADCRADRLALPVSDDGNSVWRCSNSLSPVLSCQCVRDMQWYLIVSTHLPFQ